MMSTQRKKAPYKKTGANDAVQAARDALGVLEALGDGPLRTVTGAVVGPAELFNAAREASQPYRVAAGFVSRKVLPAGLREEIRGKLFRARSRIDSRIEQTIEHQVAVGQLPIERLLRHRLFGYTKKQGVSLRLSLATCVPSLRCGGACYAHDGRERVTATLLSGCVSTVIARLWEAGSIAPDQLLPHVRQAVAMAREDALFASTEYGFSRRPRVRFAHIGEVSAFPRFANWLARAIGVESDWEVDCVVYTRHPGVADLDTRLLVVNLTIDESSGNRRIFAREGVRVVWSAWDGTLDPGADVNFLEHHEFTHSEPRGVGRVCPATSATTERRFCDAFSCTRCFDRPMAAVGPDFPEGAEVRAAVGGVRVAGDVKTRTFEGMRRGTRDLEERERFKDGE